MAQPSRAAKSPDVRRRTVTAAVLAPLVLLVTYAGTLPTAALILLAAMATAGEVADVAAGNRWRSPVPIGTASSAVAVVFAATGTYAASAGVLILGAMLVAVAMRNRSGLITAGALLYVGAAAVALVWLRQIPDHGWAVVVWLLVTVWASDGAAYAAGRGFGSRQLAPRLSPNKTWVGLGGAVVGGAVMGLIAGGVLPGVDSVVPRTGPGATGAAGAVLGLVGQGGDLLESAWKRYFHRKDSGIMLPGHGGILDRIDALLAATLAMTALVHFGGYA